jgi:hypothetical protein
MSTAASRTPLASELSDIASEFPFIPSELEGLRAAAALDIVVISILFSAFIFSVELPFLPLQLAELTASVPPLERGTASSKVSPTGANTAVTVGSRGGCDVETGSAAAAAAAAAASVVASSSSSVPAAAAAATTTTRAAASFAGCCRGDTDAATLAAVLLLLPLAVLVSDTSEPKSTNRNDKISTEPPLLSLQIEG